MIVGATACSYFQRPGGGACRAAASLVRAPGDAAVTGGENGPLREYLMVPHGCVHLGFSHLLPYSFWFFTVTSLPVLKLCPFRRHLYHSLNSFVLEAPLNNWNKQSWCN